MTLDEVIKRATIEFPRPIKFEEIDGFFKDLARRLTAHIQYIQDIGKIVDYYNDAEGKFELFAVGINGSITTGDASYRFSNNDTSVKSRTLFCLLQFSTTRRYKLQDYKPNVLALWDRARIAVGDYFAEDKTRQDAQCGDF
ncbi:MAG: hypothetical protein AABW64_02300 [Nanoarchaeota archaeon]